MSAALVPAPDPAQAATAPGSPLGRMAIFATVALAVYLTGRSVVQFPGAADHTAWLAVGVWVDLGVILPIFYYLLLVRRGSVPAVTLLPVFIACTLIASTLLTDHAPWVAHLWILALPAEGALIWLAGGTSLRILRLYRSVPRSERSFPEDFPAAVEGVLGSSRPARSLPGELVLLHLALGSWRRPPFVPAGTQPFWSHRDSAWPAIFAAALLVMATEIAVVHLLVALWNPTAAWILTGLGCYGAVWLVGDFQALRLRPTLLTPSHLLVRTGMRWTADIPLRAIQSVSPVRSGSAPEGAITLAVSGSPNWVLELDRPIRIRGLLGIERESRVLAVQMDGKEFGEALRARIEGAAAG